MFSLQASDFTGKAMAAGFTPQQANLLLSLLGDCSAPLEHNGPITLDHPSPDGSTTDGHALNIHDGSTLYVSQDAFFENDGNTDLNDLNVHGDTTYEGDTNTFDNRVNIDGDFYWHNTLIDFTVMTTDAYKVKVSSVDTTPGYLIGKLAAGTNITLTKLNSGADEDVEIMADNDKVRVTANDTTSSYLLSKLAAGANITLTETNDGGDEDVTIAATDVKVKVSSDDTTTDYLLAKLAASPGYLNWTEQNGGGDENALLTFDPTAISGYDSGVHQYLGHAAMSGALAWYTPSECPEE